MAWQDEMSHEERQAYRQQMAEKLLGPSGQPAPAPVQAQALSSSRESYLRPPDVTADTPVNPLQQRAFENTESALGTAKRYEGGLAAGTNEEITREIGRARDEISTGLQSEGEAAMSRGADPSLFRSRALEAGGRRIGELQGRLADVALGRRAEAVRGVTEAAGATTSAAGAAAGEQRLMHLGTLAQRLAEQRALTEQAEVQARLNSAPYNRLMDMMKTVSAYREDYGALGGGGGGTDVGSIFGGGGSAGGTVPFGAASSSASGGAVFGGAVPPEEGQPHYEYGGGMGRHLVYPSGRVQYG